MPGRGLPFRSCGSYATFEAGGREYDEREGVHGLEPGCLSGEAGRNEPKGEPSAECRMSGASPITDAGLEMGREVVEGWYDLWRGETLE